MAETPQRRDQLDEGALFWGTVMGFGVGGCLWLFLTPIRGLLNQRRMRQIQTDVQAQLSRDPVAESLAEGKALAQERQQYRN